MSLANKSTSAIEAEAPVVPRAAVHARPRSHGWLGPAFFLVLIAAWEGFARSGDAPNYVVSPFKVAATIVDLAVSGDLWLHMRASLYRVAIGFTGGTTAGILIGLLAGRLKPVEIYFDPLISLTYPVPKTALLPLFMTWFGIGDGSKIAIIILSVFYPVFINSFYGAKSVSANLLRAGENMGASAWRNFWLIVVPSALPQILAGVRIALALSFIVLFAAEIIGARVGLGYLITLAEDNLRFDIMYASIICIGAIGLIADRLLLALRRRLLAGRPETIGQ